MAVPETSDDKHIGRQRAKESNVAYAFLGIAAVLLLAAGTVTFHYIEGWSWVDSFYFSSIAGTTVGFGDLAPTTDASKLISVAYIFLGVSILGTLLDQRLRYHGSFVRNQTDRVMSEDADEDQS
jgi:hypothetical protein